MRHPQNESDCLLLFSPQFLPVAPPAGIGYLSSHLKHLGFEVRSEDLNAQLYDHLLSRRFLSALALIGSLKAASSTGEASENLARIVERTRCCASSIEDAKARLKSKETYSDPTRVADALAVIEDALSIIATLHNPGHISLAAGELPGNSEAADILDAAAAEDNLIVKFLRDRLAEILTHQRFPVVGISASDNTEFAVLMAAFVKEMSPDSFVVLGGSSVTAMRRIFVSNLEYFDFFDAAVLFDGEVALPAIIDAARTGNLDIAAIPNVLFRRPSDGAIVGTPIEAFDVRRVRPPDYSGLDLDLYLSPGPILPVEFRRGCYWNGCAFCNRPVALTHPIDTARAKDANQVLDELIFLESAHDSDHFYIVDDAVSPHALTELSERLIERDLDIHWMALSRFEDALSDPHTARRLKKSGCAKLGFGLESASDRVLQLMNKGLTVDTASRVIHALDDAGIALHIWAMVGFPGETHDEAQETSAFLESMVPALDRPGFSFTFSGFLLEVDSPMNKTPELYGISDCEPPDRRFVPNYSTSRVQSHSTWPATPEDVANHFTERLASRLLHSGSVTREYIVGFILGMFLSTQMGTTPRVERTSI